MSGKLSFLARIDYRMLASRISLPLLALAASWGVYSYTARFVPWFFAVATASAFEMVYIGLALADLLPEQRKRAKFISVGAVVVSVVYNWLAGFMDRADEAVLKDPAYWSKQDYWSIGREVGLAFLHGAPLAIVGFFLADLLLHQGAGHQSIVKEWQTKLEALQADWQARWDDLQMSEAAWQIKATDLQTHLQEMQIKEVNLQNEIIILQSQQKDLQASQQGLQIDIEGLTGQVTDIMKALTQRKLSAEEARARVKDLLQEIVK